MALAVTHTKVVTVPDDPNYPVGTSEWNDTHTLTGTVDATQLDQTAAYAFSGLGKTVVSVAGAAGAPAFSITGAWLTTTAGAVAQQLIEQSGATAFSGSAAGTALGINAATGFTGNALDIQIAGVTKLNVRASDGRIVSSGAASFQSLANAIGSQGAGFFTVRNSGEYGWSSTSDAVSGAIDLRITRAGAAQLQLGAANAASPVAQTLQVQSVVAGTTDTAGTDWTRITSLATGTGAGGNVVEKTGFSAKSTGSSQNTAVDREIIVAKGKVLTSASAFSICDIALPTLSMCGGAIEATIVCTDGTDMQSFTQTVTYSAVNKGGVYTTSITASTGDKSVSTGTLTTSWTIVSGTNKITIKVTPTTSLTPSSNSFLLYYRIKNNSEQATTIL